MGRPCLKEKPFPPLPTYTFKYKISSLHYFFVICYIYRCKVKVDNQLVLNVDLLYSQGPYQVKEGAVSVRLTPGLGNRGVLFVRKGSQPPKLGTMDFLKEDILPMPSSYPSETHARILIFTTVKFEVILFANIDK